MCIARGVFHAEVSEKVHTFARDWDIASGMDIFIAGGVCDRFDGAGRQSYIVNARVNCWETLNKDLWDYHAYSPSDPINYLSEREMWEETYPMSNPNVDSVPDISDLAQPEGGRVGIRTWCKFGGELGQSGKTDPNGFSYYIKEIRDSGIPIEDKEYGWSSHAGIKEPLRGIWADGALV